MGFATQGDVVDQARIELPAIMPSPRNLSRMPPCSMTASTISEKYELRNVTTCSGVIVSAIEVKLRMSEKTMVTRLASPP